MGQEVTRARPSHPLSPDSSGHFPGGLPAPGEFKLPICKEITSFRPVWAFRKLSAPELTPRCPPESADKGAETTEPALAPRHLPSDPLNLGRTLTQRLGHDNKRTVKCFAAGGIHGAIRLFGNRVQRLERCMKLLPPLSPLPHLHSALSCACNPIRLDPVLLQTRRCVLLASQGGGFAVTHSLSFKPHKTSHRPCNSSVIL